MKAEYLSSLLKKVYISDIVDRNKIRTKYYFTDIGIRNAQLNFR